MKLYQIQITQDVNTHFSSQNITVKDFLRSIRDNVWKTTKKEHKDRALNSIINNYTHKDIFAFVRNYYQKDKSSKRHLRTTLDFLINHYFLLHNNNRRKLELADLNVIDLPNKDLQPCKTWIYIFNNGKTNSTGKKQYINII